MATYLNNQKSGNTKAPRGGEMARPRNKFLPSIFEERQDEKIQDFRKALQINDDEEDYVEATVRSGTYDGDSGDENFLQDQEKPHTRANTAKLKTRGRSFSDSDVYSNSSRSKRRHSALYGGNPLNSSILGSNKSFGYGQRKITSPGVNRGRTVDMPEVIDLSNPEEARNIAKRFFEEELKLDLSDPRFDKPEDFIASLYLKAERKFSCDELWHRRRNSLQPAALLDSSEMSSFFGKKKAPVKETNQSDFYEKLKPFPQLESKYFEVCYSKPKTAGEINFVKGKLREKLTASFVKQRVDYGYRRKKERILNPIRRDVKKPNNKLRWRGQNQKTTPGEKQVDK